MVAAEAAPLMARGRCLWCRYSWRLRKDGTVQNHTLFCGSERADDPCEGSGKLPYSDYLIQVVIDLNVRVRGGHTFAGYEDIRPGTATYTRLGNATAPVRIGDKVLAVEEEEQICTYAEIISVDRERELVFLAVDWHGFRDMEAA